MMASITTSWYINQELIESKGRTQWAPALTIPTGIFHNNSRLLKTIIATLLHCTLIVNKCSIQRELVPAQELSTQPHYSLAMAFPCIVTSYKKTQMFWLTNKTACAVCYTCAVTSSFHTIIMWHHMTSYVATTKMSYISIGTGGKISKFSPCQV